MNIQQAKEVPIMAILQCFGHYPAKRNDREAWYLSPLRKEKTASFHVTFASNLWCDFGEAADRKGGNAFSLLIHLLADSGEDHTPADALRWFRNMGLGNGIPLIKANPEARIKKSLKGWRLLSIGKIQQPALVSYLENRGIPSAIAGMHLQEAHVESQATKRRLYALSFKNEEGGYELRNQFIKSCMAPKGISFIRGSGQAIHVFEGWPDFISILAQRDGKALEGDVLVMNSLSNMRMAQGYVLTNPYTKLYSWMDNDDAGAKAKKEWQAFCRTKEGLLHVPMNRQYMPHKDVNAAHMFELGLN